MAKRIELGGKHPAPEHSATTARSLSNDGKMTGLAQRIVLYAAPSTFTIDRLAHHQAPWPSGTEGIMGSSSCVADGGRSQSRSEMVKNSTPCGSGPS